MRLDDQQIEDKLLPQKLTHMAAFNAELHSVPVP